ncbi:cytochrome P450 [Xylaria scruposa]|nr:cytochrome P450 [Xylaria scruposa]
MTSSSHERSIVCLDPTPGTSRQRIEAHRIIELLEPYGPNVVTTEGSTYRFHVRMVAPSFGGNTGSKTLDADINTLTLATISLAGFGQRLESVEEQSQDVPAGYTISFLDALRNTTCNILVILLFPLWLMDMVTLEASVAKRELDNTSGDSDLVSRANLLHKVVHAVEPEDGSSQATKADSKVIKRAFTEDEVIGNFYIDMLAGYDTTANSIQYGLLALAANPEIQSKVIEELDRVYLEAAAEGRDELTYEKDFAKLEYLFGFMYETFRLYPGVLVVTKMCTEDQTIHLRDERTKKSKDVVLPAGCRVYLSASGVHYHPRYWENPEELDPERWFTDKFSRSGEGSEADEGGKHVVAAYRTRQMRGTLLTFSDGARACLGRKFAQAEYMAFFATLLRRFCITFADGVAVNKMKFSINHKSAGKVISLMPLSEFLFELVRFFLSYPIRKK